MSLENETTARLPLIEAMLLAILKSKYALSNCHSFSLINIHTNISYTASKPQQIETKLKMKSLAIILAMAMSATLAISSAIPAIESLEKRCILDGARCKKDGSLGGCCSTFCFQFENAEEGTCEVNEN